MDGYLDRELAAIADPNVNALLQEMRDLRAHVSNVYSGPLRFFLHLFFLPGGQTRFVAISHDEALVQQFLSAKVSQIRDTDIYILIRELANLPTSKMDTSSNLKIYKALNSLLKPLCLKVISKPARKKKRRP